MTKPKKTSRRSKRINFNSDVESERNENGEVSELENVENVLTDQEIVDPQETFDLGGHSRQNSQNLEKGSQKDPILIEPQNLKDNEIRSLIFQASHDNYEVIQNEISNNIERLYPKE